MGRISTKFKIVVTSGGKGNMIRKEYIGGFMYTVMFNIWTVNIVFIMQLSAIFCMFKILYVFQEESYIHQSKKSCFWPHDFQLFWRKTLIMDDYRTQLLIAKRKCIVFKTGLPFIEYGKNHNNFFVPNDISTLNIRL